MKEQNDVVVVRLVFLVGGENDNNETPTEVIIRTPTNKARVDLTGVKVEVVWPA